LFVDPYPIARFEPFMLFDIDDSALKVANTFGQVYLEQIFQKILQIRAKVRWKS
jgi:hypothetical protein